MQKFFKKIFYLLPKGDPIKFGILFLLMLVSALLEVAGIGMIPAFVSIVATPDLVMNHPYARPFIEFVGIQGQRELLIWGSGLLVGVFLVKSAYIIVFNYFEARFVHNRKFWIARRMMTTYMQAPYTFHLNRNSAELLRNITKEVNITFNVIMDTLKISREGIMAVSILVFLLLMEPLITVMVVAMSGICGGGFILLTQKKVKKFGREDQGYRKQMIQSVNQGLGGIKDARLLNREQEFINQFNDAAFKSSRLNAYMRFIMQIPRPVIETTAVMGIMLIAGFMVFQGREMAAIIPILTLFAMAVVRLMPAVQQIGSIYTNLIYNMVAVEPIYYDLKNLEMETSNFRKDRKSKQKLTLENELAVENVSYSYPGSGEPALKEVSFAIPHGSSVGFVGESGAGKSTIVDLILGLLKPTKGRILVDGKNIHKALSAWQRNIGYIPQTIYMADDTLRKNIAFGLPDEQINDDDVMEAVRMAQLDELVGTLPDGLDTFIGEHGTRLSGGQRQRVGIARALYHKPSVLVMDEATSALDNITEKEITRAIERLKGERTVIMIAHRLTTVENCDSLFLMRDGTIVDSGTYSELADQNDEFRKMALIN